MLLLFLISLFLPNYKENKYLQKEFILNVQNSYALVVLSCCMYNLCCYHIYNDFSRIYLSFSILSNYMLFDLLICSDFTIYVHHIACIVGTHIIINNEVFYLSIKPQVVLFLTTEMSTFFLTIRCIFSIFKTNNNTVTVTKFLQIVDALFVSSFFYTRIYLFYNYIILSERFYELFHEHLNPTREYLLIWCVFTLFTLNIYWGCIIIKKIFKPIQSSSCNSFITIENVLKYSISATFLARVYYYWNHFSNPIYWIDTFSIGGLVFTSYIYHNSISVELTHSSQNANILSQSIIEYLIADVAWIHFHTFTGIFTHIIFTNNYYKMWMILFLGFTHIYCHSLYVGIIRGLQSSNKVIMHIPQSKNAPINPNAVSYYENLSLNVCVGFPMIVDLSLAIFSVQYFYIRQQLITVILFMMIIKLIEPFHQYTHLFWHFLVFLNSTLVAKANV
jgi:hypothetical protein